MTVNLRRIAPTAVAARLAAGLRDRLPAEPRPGRASAAGQAVRRRGLRALEQLVVLRPSRARLQRPVPARGLAADAAGGRSDRRGRHGGGVRVAGLAALSASRPGSARCGSGRRPPSISTRAGWPSRSDCCRRSPPRWALQRRRPCPRRRAGRADGAGQPGGRVVRRPHGGRVRDRAADRRA